MKLKYHTLFFVIFTNIMAFLAEAQECLSDEPNCPSCNGIISTDIGAPVNSGRSEMLNRFNWTSDALTVYHPSGGYWGGTNTPFQITNPFYTNDAYLSNLNYFNFLFADRIPSNLDFHPEDGWELIHKGNGYDLNESTLLPTADNRIGPYFILYNKHTGTLRTFVAFSNIGVNDIMLSILQFKKTLGLSYSGLLNKYENIIAPLNQPTNVSQVVQGSNATIAGQFFSADFKMNYDPRVCNYSSSLYLDFKTKNSGTIRLDGRLVGTNVPLDGSGNSPLLNGRDFLTAVNNQNFSVQGGMLTYNNIDKLVAKYKEQETNIFVKLGIEALKSILKGVAKPLDDILDKAASNFATSHLINQSILGVTIKDSVKVGLGALGAGASYLGGLLSSDKKTPNISFIEAEMALSGSVVYTPGLGSGAIEIAQPGSKGTENASIVPKKYYPAYNEALGLFSVLTKPAINIYNGINGQGQCPGDPPAFNYYSYRNIQFDPSSLKYFFNPASEVDVSKSRVYGAIEIIVPSDHSVPGANLISSKTSTKTFMTDFFPIESLYRARPTVTKAYVCAPGIIPIANGIIVNLKLQVFYEFKPNRYGKTNRFWEVLTYPTQSNLVTSPLTDITSPKFNSAPIVFYNSGGYQFNSSSNYETRGSATVYDQLITTSGVSVSITGGTLSTIAANGSIGAGISLRTKQFLNEYDDPQIYQVSSTYVKNFCSQTGQYQSKSATAAAARLPQEEERNKDSLIDKDSYKLISFPNPTTGKLSFQYYVEEPSQVRLNLISTTGSVVATPVDAYQEAGPYEFAYDASNLPAGIYIYTLETNKGRETKRLVIIK
jgi:hypothetical protein